MKNLLTIITHLGTSLKYPRWKNRSIIITNNLAMICSALILLLVLIHGITHAGEKIIVVGIVLVVLLLTIPFISKSGKIDASRTVLTLTLVLGTLALTLIRKMTSVDVVSVNTFYQPRTAIVFFSIIPFATIHFAERRLLVVNLLIGMFALLLFDPLHNFMGVGFTQLGYSDPDYYYTNVIFLIIYLVAVASMASFKRIVDKYEHENEILINSLNSKTILIENQKEELESQGEVLRQLLLEKDKDLSNVTQELIKFNLDLLQYSYTISHNLRGPVARILGLIDLIKQGTDADRQVYLEHVLTSTRALDGIIHDLNKIIDIRSDSYIIRENVFIDGLVDQVLGLLAIPIKTYGVKITKQIGVKEFFIAKSRINHILFSLISNAIQYRREGRITEIQIRTFRQGDEVVLEIRDNGRGMDLNAIGENLFKPFKRFHPEVSGKGIGLFLVKLQVERLHGRVEVQSTVGVGTTFLFYLKDWNNEVAVTAI